MKMTIREYATKAGVSRSVAKRRIDGGKVRGVKEDGLWYVLTEDEPDSQPGPAAENAEMVNLDQELKKAKLAQIAADAKLKEQKWSETMARVRVEFAQDYFDCFCAAFETYKSAMISARLPKETLRRLKAAWKRSCDKMQTLLAERCAARDAEGMA